MGSGFFSSWTFWAMLSAVFAALTAIFGKIGIENVNSDFATLLRTGVVLVSLALILYATGQYQSLESISAKSYLFLLLSGLATGASWLCYYRALKLGPASLVAPVDKLSVVIVAVIGVALLGEKLDLRQWSAIGLITAGVVLLAVRR
ncbi:EamA family transporter [Pseudomonas piscis]|uniref:EamA family transporter n=1 Tax=Pseudomonas piscis TaxID=2614538 RepID=A0A7X1PH35_9PSED|nr:EamA family transporter [Pseudomonas piscis]MQA51787.1 EamA family transporter [Pseudomonas piscis]